MECEEGPENRTARSSGLSSSDQDSCEGWGFENDVEFDETDPWDRTRPDPDSGSRSSNSQSSSSSDSCSSLLDSRSKDNQQEGVQQQKPVFAPAGQVIQGLCMEDYYQEQLDDNGDDVPRQGMKRVNDYIDAQYKNKVERQFVSPDDPRAIFQQLPIPIQQHIFHTFPGSIEEVMWLYLNNLVSTLEPNDLKEMESFSGNKCKVDGLKYLLLNWFIRQGMTQADAESHREKMMADTKYAEYQQPANYGGGF
jgi:hypothetical protein